MDDLVDNLKKQFNEQIVIDVNDSSLTLSLNFKGGNKTPNNLGDEDEFKEMLEKFGELTEEIHMDFKFEVDSQKIEIKFNSQEDMEKVHLSLERSFERAVEFYKRALFGDFTVVKDLGDFKE